MKAFIFFTFFSIFMTFLLQQKDSITSHINKPAVVVLSFKGTFIVKDSKDSIYEVKEAQGLISKYKTGDTIR